MPTTLHENRPSAGIGVVEVQKPMVFCDFQHARATLCGDRRGRGAETHVFFAISNMPARPSAGIGVVEVQKPRVFCDLYSSRATLCGDRRGRGAKTHGFLRFLRCSRNPLRESAWSRCKNSFFFATFVVRTGPRELSRGSRACSRNRRVAGSNPPWSAGGHRKMQLAFFKATCAEQLVQTNLHRPVCAERLA